MLVRFLMVARHYRELVCWQLANDLKRRVYAFIAKPSVAKDFDFCRQIRGSARGGPRTIVEGFGRFRSADFARYLEYARASLMETQNHLDDALDNNYLSAADHKALFGLAGRAIGATTKLHAYLQTCKGPFKAPQNPGKQDPRGTADPNSNSESRTTNDEPRTTNHEPRTRNVAPRTRNPEPGTENEP